MVAPNITAPIVPSTDYISLFFQNPVYYFAYPWLASGGAFIIAFIFALTIVSIFNNTYSLAATSLALVLILYLSAPYLPREAKMIFTMLIVLMITYGISRIVKKST